MKDEAGSQFVFGIALPTLLLIWILFNLGTGSIYLPGPSGQRLPLRPQSDSMLLWSFVSLKFGIGLGLFGWFWMANRPEYDRHVAYVQLASIIIVAIGLLILAWYSITTFSEIFSV